MLAEGVAGLGESPFPPRELPKRSRSTGLRVLSKTGGDLSIQRGKAMKSKWNELTSADKEALRQMSRGSIALNRTKATEDRLISLGLATQKLGGAGINKAGQELLLRNYRR